MKKPVKKLKKVKSLERVKKMIYTPTTNEQHYAYKSQIAYFGLTVQDFLHNAIPRHLEYLKKRKL